MHQVGIDMVEVTRLRRTLERWGPRFLRRIYTDSELQACHRRLPELAARFAAKEAVMKALGTGRQGVGWRDIEVLSSPRTQPQVRLYGRAERRARELGLSHLSLSLSHTREWGLAVVLGDQQEGRP
ncbi:MAG: holo-ACP synthase [Chloroflexi bacterium]|nr:holo-ACP synthase [Chloroflexota bacterium]